MDKQLYNHFSRVFAYPDEDSQAHTAALYEMLQKSYPEGAKVFARFADYIADADMDRLEEIYTKTFHIQAICYLDLGYTIFGEDYKRGEFLVNMMQECEKNNLDPGEELPDNLSVMLRLLPVMKDEGIRDELAVRILVPGMDSMIGEFSSARKELKAKVLKKKHDAVLDEDQENGNVYKNALETLKAVLLEDFKDTKLADLEKEHNKEDDAFLQSCFASSLSMYKNMGL